MFMPTPCYANRCEGRVGGHDMIHVLLVNEQRLFNEAIHSLLSTKQDIQVSGMVTDGIKAMQFIEEHQPDVVVLDTHTPTMNGIQLTVHIKEKFPQIKVVLLSEAIKEELVIQGVIAGADAFLIKTIDAHGLIQAIYDTYNNEIVFSGEVAKILAT